METNPSKTIVTIVVLVVLVLAGAMYVQSQRSIDDVPAPDDVACTEEAMLCPDGSYVGRSGPDCEFDACPTPPIVPGPTPLPADDVICTMDAYQCPDGSWVGRTGPNCQFVCP